MENKILVFKKLANIFKKNGYRLYLVGGTVRDYLLNKELADMDIVTDATPAEIKQFFTEGEANYVFERFGAVTIKFEDIKFDLTTLREEKGYLDFRHPNKICFVREIAKDYLRRDFSVNAMYLDDELKLYDFANGEVDLQSKKLSFIGNADVRIKEDPLRILRAIRFALSLGFEMDQEMIEAINNNIILLNKLNKDKIKQELSKIKNVQEDVKFNLFNKFNITYLLDVLK